MATSARQPTSISFSPPPPLQRVKDALMILPDQAAKELEPEWFEEGENIRVADAFAESQGLSIRFTPIEAAWPVTCRQ
jgi:hypothetical protein